MNDVYNFNIMQVQLSNCKHISGLLVVADFDTFILQRMLHIMLITEQQTS